MLTVVVRRLVPCLVFVVLLVGFIGLWAQFHEVHTVDSGIERDRSGRLYVIGCGEGGGIEELTLIPEGVRPDDWNNAGTERYNIRAKGTRVSKRVDLLGPGVGYVVTGTLDPDGVVTVVSFDLTGGTDSATVWTLDLGRLQPGDIASQGGVSRSSTSRDSNDCAS